MRSACTEQPGKKSFGEASWGRWAARIGVELLLLRSPEIWAVARLGQVGVILSEDFNPGAVPDGVSFANPLDTVHSTSPP